MPNNWVKGLVHDHSEDGTYLILVLRKTRTKQAVFFSDRVRCPP